MSSSRQTGSVSGETMARLALWRERELCLADWRRVLGDYFDAVSCFLVRLAGTVADSYPEPEAGVPLVIRLVWDGTYTARSEVADGPYGDCVEGLTAEDVERYRVDWGAVAEAVAGCLGVQFHAGRGPVGNEWVRSIGVDRSGRSPRGVYLVIARDATEALGWLGPLVRGGQAMVVVTCHDEVCADLLESKAHGYVALDRDTEFVAERERWRLQMRGATGAAAAGAGLPVKGEPLSLRGKRFCIEDDYSSVWRVRPKKKFPTPQHKCQLALQVLVECGAGSFKTALTKQEFCEAVWCRQEIQRALWPKEAKPVSFFRYRGKKGTDCHAFYGPMVRTDKRGKYWLDL